MAPTGRDVAREVLLRVDQGGAFAGRTLTSALDRARLSPVDRALATEIVYGVLRLRARLDRALAARSSTGSVRVDPATTAALRVAAYQMLFLSRIPSHAAVDDAVESIKVRKGARLAGFANALLRRIASEGEPPPPGEASSGMAKALFETSLPRWIAEEISSLFGVEAEPILRALAAPAPTWLRVNLLRAEPDQLVRRLAVEADGATIRRSSAVPEALGVSDLGRSPADLASFREGLFAVQDLGAQAVTRLLDPQPGMRVLDGCAGLGGKSAHLAALLGGGGRIVAADLSPRKLAAARREWARLGLDGLETVAGDLTDPALDLGGPFDALLLDAPCSGLGVLRRHPELKWRRTPAEIAELAALQERLLRALVPRLRPGGVLVYAVCSFTLRETEQQLARLEREHGLRVEPPADLALRPLCDERGILRTRPDRDGADLFFAARLRLVG